MDRRTNTSAHLRTIARSLAALPNVRCDIAVVRSDAALQRFLTRCQPDVLYLLAHSERGRGVISSSGVVSARCVHGRAVHRNSRAPLVVIWNTCYGVESGFVPAWLAAGASTVVAADGALPVAAMTTLAETLFARWARDDLTTAVAHANEHLNDPVARMQIFSAVHG